MREIASATYGIRGEMITFSYYLAVIDAMEEEALVVAAIAVVDPWGATRAYTRQWPLRRWSVPTQVNTEAKFVHDPLSRERFRVKESTL